MITFDCNTMSPMVQKVSFLHFIASIPASFSATFASQHATHLLSLLLQYATFIQYNMIFMPLVLQGWFCYCRAPYITGLDGTFPPFTLRASTQTEPYCQI